MDKSATNQSAELKVGKGSLKVINKPLLEVYGPFGLLEVYGPFGLLEVYGPFGLLEVYGPFHYLSHTFTIY